MPLGFTMASRKIVPYLTAVEPVTVKSILQPVAQKEEATKEAAVRAPDSPTILPNDASLPIQATERAKFNTINLMMTQIKIAQTSFDLPQVDLVGEKPTCSCR